MSIAAKITMIVSSVHGTNSNINNSGSKIFICKKEYVNAGELLTQLDQLVTDILDYHDENNEWPTVELKHPENDS